MLVRLCAGGDHGELSFFAAQHGPKGSYCKYRPLWPIFMAHMLIPQSLTCVGLGSMCNEQCVFINTICQMLALFTRSPTQPNPTITH